MAKTKPNICQDRAILADLGGPDVLQAQARREGPGSEGQGLGFNVCVAPRDVHSAQLTRRDEGPSRNGEERRED
jgi:hypothetical protein